jgi:predicted membrane chloride channel (bestrophin family)
MIEYYKGAFSINLLLRISGSAVYRAMIPGLFSVCVYLWVAFKYNQIFNEDPVPLVHPQAMGMLISSVSLLIVFKANQAYNRHWEAYSRVFAMLSRWQDAAQHMVAYHFQCDHYIAMRPPSYFDHFDLNGMFLTRDRERHVQNLPQEISEARKLRKSINFVTDQKKRQRSERWDKFEEEVLVQEESETENLPEPLFEEIRLDGGWGKLFHDSRRSRNTFTYYNPMKTDEIPKEGFASYQGGRTPMLYLQEMVHLTSLLSAVALSTLRNDIDGAESPLDVYEIGSPWPEADPDKIKGKGRMSIYERFLRMVGADLSSSARTKYNASRPLSVIGGVSDAEIYFLQMAKGSYAKTVLAWNWLSEFMIREHIAGSTGVIGDALISRPMQFLGNGMAEYNHARKIMYVPFPFPHAQISVFFVAIVVPGIPILMDQYVSDNWLAALMTFFSVVGLFGLHEVSRELENPFRKPPNDVPICTLQAQSNEALITMFAGYHPDAYFGGFEPTTSGTPHDFCADDGSYFHARPKGDRTMSESSGHSQFNSSEGSESEGASGAGAINEGDDELDEIQKEMEEHVIAMRRLRAKLHARQRHRKAVFTSVSHGGTSSIDCSSRSQTDD